MPVYVEWSTASSIATAVTEVDMDIGVQSGTNSDGVW